jgi:phospholipase/carboxylesterase
VALFISRAEHVVSGPAFEKSGLAHRVRRGTGPGPYPTIVMLHGREGDEDSMWLLQPALPPGWLVVAPRGMVADPVAGYDWMAGGAGRWPVLDDFGDAVARLTRLVEVLPHLYQADPRATYFMGFSQGAAAAYATVIAHPRLVSAVAGIAGFVPTDCNAREAAPLAGLPVFMAVGTTDPQVPLARSRACARALTDIGAELTYHEYNVGHKLSTQGMRDLRAWWLEQLAGRQAED